VELFAEGHRLPGFKSSVIACQTPPEHKAKPDVPDDMVQAGWEDYLFARYPEAEAKFQRALEKDARLADAHTGLAFLKLSATLPSAPRGQSRLGHLP
jgi:hypothetical protein